MYGKCNHLPAIQATLHTDIPGHPHFASSPFSVLPSSSSSSSSSSPSFPLLLLVLYFFLFRYADAVHRVPSHFDVYATEARDAATGDADATRATGATGATGATDATDAMEGMRKRARWVGRSFRPTYRVSALPVSGGAARLVFFVCAATESGLTRSLQTAPSITVDLV